MIDDSEIEDFLEHFGVKGMHWGVQNSSRKAGKQEVQNLSKNAREIIRESTRATTKEARAKAAKRYKKEILDKAQTKEFKAAYQKANTMGKGEIATHILLLGPLAALTISQTQKGYAQIRKEGYQQEIDAAHNILREMRKP